MHLIGLPMYTNKLCWIGPHHHVCPCHRLLSSVAYPMLFVTHSLIFTSTEKPCVHWYCATQFSLTLPMLMPINSSHTTASCCSNTISTQWVEVNVTTSYIIHFTDTLVYKLETVTLFYHNAMHSENWNPESWLPVSDYFSCWCTERFPVPVTMYGPWTIIVFTVNNMKLQAINYRSDDW